MIRKSVKSVKSRRSRVATFETLSPRELMAGDLRVQSDYLIPPHYSQKLTAEQWAARVLDANEFYSAGGQDQSSVEPARFESEEQARKYLTDALLKSWQNVLGKPVNDKFPVGYSLYDSIFTGDTRDASINAAAFGLAAVTADHSTSVSTNNQIASVDEADQFEVSTDGFVYALGSNAEGTSSSVKIFDARDPKNLLKVAEIDVAGFNTQMHLVGDQLILVSSALTTALGDGGSLVQVYDVADPSNPSLQTSLQVNGWMLQSRFSDGKLTLFGNQYVSTLRPLFISDDPSAIYTGLPETAIGRFETAEEFAARIQPLVIGWITPDILVDGSETATDVGDWQDLVLGRGVDLHQRFTVFSFGLTDGGLQVIDSESLLGTSTGVTYVDGNSIYTSHAMNGWRATDNLLFELLPPRTAIYSFDVTADEVAFAAAGAIPGSIRDSRMMDEYDGHLRIFSDVRNLGIASTDLYILKPNDGKFDVVGQLTDVADGQALYSAYFDEEQAMITTWIANIPDQWSSSLPSDPLHGFDLSDPANPIELSELVIPGVSTYLQRVDANHLIGVGYIESGTGDWRQQISLYDVSDLADLKVVDVWVSSNSIVPNFLGSFQNALAVHFDPNSQLLTLASTAFGNGTGAGVTAFKVDASSEDPLQYLGQLGDENHIGLRSAVLGDTLFTMSVAWLQSYSVSDLSNELDREILVKKGVGDWISLQETQSAEVNVLANDYSLGGRVTSITSSTLGAAVRILEDGATIRYEASEIEGPWKQEQLTYTVTLQNGETYTDTLTVSLYSIEPISSEPISSEPVTPIIHVPIEFTPGTVKTDTGGPSESILITKTSTPIDGDVNGDGEVSPHDVLLAVEHLNQQSKRLAAGEALVATVLDSALLDISGDGEFSPLDVLILVERLNANAAMLASGEATSAATPNVNSLAADEAMYSLFSLDSFDQSDIRLRKRSGF